MQENFDKIDLGIDLYGSELMIYHESNIENILFVQIKSQNCGIIVFTFNGIIRLIDWGWKASSFCLNNNKTDIFRSTLEEYYDCTSYSVPKSHPFKHFQFIDSTSEPCMEIICENFEYKSLDRESQCS